MAGLTPETFWLTLTALLTGLHWVPYILERISEQGLVTAMGNQRPVHMERADWAARLKFAHGNAVESLVVFAALALAVHVTGLGNGATATACAVYFLARLAHTVIYAMGISVLRTLAFVIGFFATLTLAIRLLGVI